MREKILYITGGAAVTLLVYNLYTMFMSLPDEAAQDAIYRIIFFHVPSAWTFMVAAFASMVMSVLFLVKNDARYDALAASAAEAAPAAGRTGG